MRVLDLSSNVVHGLGVLAGLAAGLGAARLADALPRRYDIEHRVEGSPRARRNAALVLLMVALGLFFAHRVTIAATTSLDGAVFAFAVDLTLCTALAAAAAIDLEHMILPNELTVGGALLALATSPWRGVGLAGSVVGTVVGLALTYLPFVLYKRLRGRSGMGLGDAKLALVAGAWLGASGAVFVVCAGAQQSALCAIVMRATGTSFAVPESVRAELAELRTKAGAGDLDARAVLADDPMAACLNENGDDDGDESLAAMRLPMGPFLVLACLEFVLARRQILLLFDRYIAPP
jgi:leader peptidase (prepilin peptidase)/N-methyltransferase